MYKKSKYYRPLCQLKNLIYKNVIIVFYFSELNRDFPYNKTSNAFSLELFQQKHVVTLTFDLPMNKIHILSNDELAMLFVINNFINKMPNEGTKSLYINVEQDKIHLILDVLKTYSNSRLKSKNAKVNFSFKITNNFL